MKQEKLTTLQIKQKMIHLNSEVMKYQKRVKDYEENYHYQLLKELRMENESLIEKNAQSAENLKRVTEEKEKLENQVQGMRLALETAHKTIKEHTENETRMKKEILEKKRTKIIQDEKQGEQGSGFTEKPSAGMKGLIVQEANKYKDPRELPLNDDWFLRSIQKPNQKKEKKKK